MSVSALFSRIKISFQDRRKLAFAGLLGLVLLLGTFLRFYNLGAGGVGNMACAITLNSLLTPLDHLFANTRPGRW